MSMTKNFLILKITNSSQRNKLRARKLQKERRNEEENDIILFY